MSITTAAPDPQHLQKQTRAFCYNCRHVMAVMDVKKDVVNVFPTAIPRSPAPDIKPVRSRIVLRIDKHAITFRRHRRWCARWMTIGSASVSTHSFLGLYLVLADPMIPSKSSVPAPVRAPVVEKWAIKIFVAFHLVETVSNPHALAALDQRSASTPGNC
jgi:hypothetical protein